MFEDQTKQFINKIKKNIVDTDSVDSSLQLISLIEKLKNGLTKK